MPVAMTDENSTKYYLHYDQVGSLRAISDSNQNIVKEITYDTYGNILSDTNSSLSVPFGFAGGLYDADTKLTRFGYRDYDAYTGKWTAKDPIGFSGGDSNLYGYVLGDPVNFVDPEGLEGASLGRRGGIVIPIPRIDIDRAWRDFEYWWYSPHWWNTSPPNDPPRDDCENENEEFCKGEINSAIIFCDYAKNDPDMPGIYGGSERACVLARISSECVKYYRGY